MCQYYSEQAKSLAKLFLPLTEQNIQSMHRQYVGDITALEWALIFVLLRKYERSKASVLLECRVQWRIV